MEGTARRAHTSAYARGTSGYRAPELVKDFHYTNKVDIWALGCILYELVFRKKTFDNDMAVLSYALSKQELKIPAGPLGFHPSDQRELSVIPSPDKSLNSILSEMLALDPLKWPTAQRLCEIFSTDPSPSNATEASVCPNAGTHFNYQVGANEQAPPRRPMGTNLFPFIQ